MIQEPDCTQQNAINHLVFTNPLDKMFAKRGITRDTLREDYPFWKLQLTEEEVNTIKSDVNPGNLHHKGLECAILFAEWYKRDYMGKMPEKRDVAKWAGINQKEHQKKFFDVAIEAITGSKYTIIKKQINLYFRTLLCLGGLPITYIKENTNNIQGIVPMFKSLVSNLSKATDFDWKKLDSPDYDALADIEEYATIIGVPNTVKENLAAAAMQTARGIICNDRRFLPFDADDEDIKEFIELLNKEKKSTRKHQNLNFALQWCYDASQRQFLVQVNAPKEIAAHEIVDDHGKQLDGTSPNLFKLFIANSEVATYHFANEEVDNQNQKIYKFRREGSVLPVPITLDQAMVEVTVKSDDHQKLALNLPNNSVPDFSEPQVWVQNEKNLSLYEKFTKQSSNHFLALYDSKDWTIRREEKASIEASKIIATAFEDTLTLVHRKAGEELTLRSTVSEYQVALLGTELPWIEKASHMLFARVPLIKVYDADNKVVSPKDYTCWYRTEPHSSRGEDVGPWQELKPYTQLPLGFIAIKVELPDGMEHIQRGYSIGDVRFTTKDAKEDCLTLVAESCSQLKIEAIEREGLTITPQKPEMNAQSWRIQQKDIQQKDINTRPATCGFRLSVEGHRSTTIHVALGFHGVLLADVEGNRVISQTPLSLYNLNHYMLHSYEGNHIGKLSMIRAEVNDYSKEEIHRGALQLQLMDKGLIADVDIPRYTITQEERSTGTSITFPIEKGSRSLSEYISDHYKRLLCAHTDRSYHPEYMVKLEIGERYEYNDRVSLVNGTAYYLKEFLLTTVHEEGLFCVQELFDNAIKTPYNGQLYALPVDWDIKPQDIQAIPLEKSAIQANSFALPEDFNHKEFIIFSGSNDKRKVVPRFHSFSPDLTGTSEQRKSFREERIKQWKRSLTWEKCWEIGGKWEEVCRVFSILADHQVPYSTHLAFEIIARDAKLLAKFVIAMCSLPKTSNETYQSDLLRDGGLRRFERELSTAIHWVQPSVWNELFLQPEALAHHKQFSKVMTNSFRIARNMESDNEEGTSDTQNKKAEKECLDAFIQYLQQGTKPNQGKITHADANKYKSYLNGVDKDFADLPLLPEKILEVHKIFNPYFLPQALKSLRVYSPVYKIQQALLISPLIVAEHLKGSDRWNLFAEEQKDPNRWNLFAKEQKDLAAVISFYYHQFPGVYIKMLMKGLSIN